MSALCKMPWEFTDEEFDAIEDALLEAKGWIAKRTPGHNWVCYALEVLRKDIDKPLPEPPSAKDGLYLYQRWKPDYPDDFD